MAIRILGNRQCCGVVDNVSYAQGSFGNYSLPTRFNCLSEQGVRGLDELIGLPALQPVPGPSRSSVGGEGHECLVYKYTWSIGCCVIWCNTSVPSSCHSSVAFKPRYSYLVPFHHLPPVSRKPMDFLSYGSGSVTVQVLQE